MSTDAANRNLLTDSKPTTAGEGVSPGDATSSEELKGEKKVEGNSTIATAKPDKSLKNINLTEVGPRLVQKHTKLLSELVKSRPICCSTRDVRICF